MAGLAPHPDYLTGKVSDPRYPVLTPEQYRDWQVWADLYPPAELVQQWQMARLGLLWASTDSSLEDFIPYDFFNRRGADTMTPEQILASLPPAKRKNASTSNSRGSSPPGADSGPDSTTDGDSNGGD